MNFSFICMFFTIGIVTTVLRYMFFDTHPGVVWSVCTCVVSQMGGIHIFVIIHLPQVVVLPVHRFVIVSVTEWKKSVTSLNDLSFSSLLHRDCIFADRFRQLLIVCPVSVVWFVS